MDLGLRLENGRGSCEGSIRNINSVPIGDKTEFYRVYSNRIKVPMYLKIME